jgi:hypothetical protein
MLRVFLVIDDYNELVYLQSLLRKLGFDVEGLQNQKKYADVSLGFNPQIVVTTSKGTKVDGLMLAQSIHKRRGVPKILALRTDNTYAPEDFAASGIDLVVDSPVVPKKFISALANLGAIDEAPLLEKYSKIQASSDAGIADAHSIMQFDDNGQPVEDIRRVRSAIDSAVGSKPMNQQSDAVLDSAASGDAQVISQHHTQDVDPKRNERFQKCKKEIGSLPKQNFDRDRIREFNKHLRAKPLSEDYEEIEEDKKKFVKALFKSKPE